MTPGVEAGCHLLTAGGTTYLLIWDGGEIVDGQRVEVFGAVRPDAMTTCQQGVPFHGRAARGEREPLNELRSPGGGPGSAGGGAGSLSPQA